MSRKLPDSLDSTEEHPLQLWMSKQSRQRMAPTHPNSHGQVDMEGKEIRNKFGGLSWDGVGGKI